MIACFIPHLELPELRDGTPLQLREAGGKITILVTVHSPVCDGCREYLDSLAPLAPEFDSWDARLLVVVPGPIANARALHLTFGTVLRDDCGCIADGISASVVVADRYGQVFETVRAGASHELPGPRELEEWLKYIGTLCPE